MKPDDYIRGARHGREAHDLELESMCDPLLADALDGFDAVPGGPGEHPAALERLAEGIARSASAGRVAARARSAKLRERRIRGWSVASAAVLLAAVAGGGAWMLRNGVRTDSPTLANQPSGIGYPGEVVEILPPVTAIEEQTARNVAAAEPTPLPEPTDMSEMMLDSNEIPLMAGIVDVMADTVVVPEAGVAPEIEVEAEVLAEAVIVPGIEADSVVEAGVAADAMAVQSHAARAVEMPAPAPVEALAKIQAPARDSTQTDAFRRHVADRNRERSAVMGPVTISFEVGADGRPRDVQIVESPTPELGDFARTMLDEGPDWPTEPSHKLITINL